MLCAVCSTRGVAAFGTDCLKSYVMQQSESVRERESRCASVHARRGGMVDLGFRALGAEQDLPRPSLSPRQQHVSVQPFTTIHNSTLHTSPLRGSTPESAPGDFISGVSRRSARGSDGGTATCLSPLKLNRLHWSKPPRRQSSLRSPPSPIHLFPVSRHCLCYEPREMENATRAFAGVSEPLCQNFCVRSKACVRTPCVKRSACRGAPSPAQLTETPPRSQTRRPCKNTHAAAALALPRPPAPAHAPGLAQLSPPPSAPAPRPPLGPPRY